MTNEIKKLYKNVGLDNLWVERYDDSDGNEYESWYHHIKSMMEKNGWTLTEARNVAKKECRKELLPFTAEKQLLLIQWLAKTRPIHINLLLDKWTIEGMVRYGIKYDTFEDALSGYINQIWQILSEEEKQQVKGILE